MTKRLAVLAALSLVLAAPPARASFHLTKIVQVYTGSQGAATSQYVMLQSFAAGQNFVGGHMIEVFDPSGASLGGATFANGVSNGAAQATILIATAAAQTEFGVAPDLVLPSALMAPAGGKVCFDTIDCFAWGNYVGSPTGVGTPYSAATGIATGKAAIRRLDIAGGATTLDAADDTDNCANDFVEGSPAPENNAGMTSGGGDMAMSVDMAGADLAASPDLTAAPAPDLATGGGTSTGCACQLGGHAPAPLASSLLAAGLVVALARRRRRR
jgi:MYXO-CTERM domain-containing protein